MRHKIVLGNSGLTLVETLLGVSLLAISTFLAMHLLGDIANRKMKSNFNSHLAHIKSVIESPIVHTGVCTAHFKDLALNGATPEQSIISVTKLARDPAKTKLILEVGKLPFLNLRGFDGVVQGMKLHNFKKANESPQLFSANQNLLAGQIYYWSKFRVDFGKPNSVGGIDSFYLETPVLLEVSPSNVIIGCSKVSQSLVSLVNVSLGSTAGNCTSLNSTDYSQAASVVSSKSECHCGCDPGTTRCGLSSLRKSIDYYDPTLNQWVTTCEDKTCIAYSEVVCAVSRSQ